MVVAFLWNLNRLLSRPFLRMDEFLLCGQEFGAVDLCQRFALFYISAGVIHIKLFNPAFDFCIDRGLVPLVYLDSTHGPDGLLNGLDGRLDGLDADSLLQFRRNLDLGNLLHRLILLPLRWCLCLRRCLFGLLDGRWR